MTESSQVEQMAERLSHLEEKLQRLDTLESIAAISELKSRYLRQMDKLVLAEERDNGPGNAKELANLFAEDAVWNGGEFYGEYRGRDEIRQFLDKLAGASRYTKHVTMNPEIKVNGNTATALWQLVVLAVDLQGGEGMWKGGYYKDTYRKTPDGVWQITYTEVRIERAYYETCGGAFDYSGRKAENGLLPPGAREGKR